MSTATSNVRFIPPAPDLEHAREFLDLFDPAARFFTFQTFDDSKAKDPCSAAIWHGTLDLLAADLSRLHARGAGVFYTANETDGRGRKAANITRVRAIWQDDDDGAGHPPAPFPTAHLVIETSPGRHQRLWLVEGMTFEQHRVAVRALATRFGGDKNATDLARVLRLPGFCHQKREPFMVRMVGGINYDLGDRCPPYKAGEILEALGCDALPPATLVKDADAGNVVCATDTPEDLARCRQWIAASPDVYEGGRDNAAFAAAARCADLGAQHSLRELVGEWNEAKCNPPLDDADLDRIAASALKNRQKAVGCDSCVVLSNVFAPVEAPPSAALDADGGRRQRKPLAERIKPLNLTDDGWKRLPARPWIAKDRLIRRKLTMLVAPGATGKSLLSLQWACAVAMGNGDWCGLNVRERGNVLVVNTEEDMDELERRVYAIAEHFKLPKHDINGRLHLIGEDDEGFVAVKRERDRLIIGPDAHSLVDYVVRNQIDVVIVDPFVETHEANENDTGEMRDVMKLWKQIAQRTGAALFLVHHTKKPPLASSKGFAGSADSGRGSGVQVNAVRIQLTLYNCADEGEVPGLKIPKSELHLYVRLDDGKVNYSLKSPHPRVFKRVTVPHPSEPVGVLVPVIPTVDECAEELLKRAEELVSEALRGGEILSPNPRAGNYAGRWLHKKLMDRGFCKEQCATAIKTLEEIALCVVEYKNKGDTAEKYVLRDEASGGSPAVPTSGGSGGSPAVASETAGGQ